MFVFSYLPARSNLMIIEHEINKRSIAKLDYSSRENLRRAKGCDISLLTQFGEGGGVCK